MSERVILRYGGMEYLKRVRSGVHLSVREESLHSLPHIERMVLPGMGVDLREPHDEVHILAYVWSKDNRVLSKPREIVILRI